MYCTFDDLVDQLPEYDLIQLTDDENTGVLDGDKIAAAIANATDIINGYVMGRYGAFPEGGVPGLIRTICVDVTIYKLYERRMAGNVPESILQRYKNALALLRDIQANKVQLPVDPLPGEDGGTGEFRVRRSMAREFGADVLSQF